MKLFKIINAFQTLEILSENEYLSEKELWEIYKLRKILKTHVEFEQEREGAIREKYLPLADAEGMLSPADAKAYTQEMQSVVNLDVEIEDYKKPEIKFVKGMNCKITEPLEDFIEFLPPAE